MGSRATCAQPSNADFGPARYRVLPAEWEFWQGRPSRLHDRIRYRQDAHGVWTRERLAP